MTSTSINFRKQLFHLYDTVKGGKVRSHLENLNSLSENLKSEDIANRQRENLNLLIEEISQHVPAYSRYNQYSDLEEMPVISKEELKKNYVSFFSDKFKKDDLVEAKTSGSYGTPFSFFMSKDRKARQQAEIIFFGKSSGYYIGQKHAYIRSTVKSPLKLWLQNELLISPSVVNEKYLAETRERLINSKSELLIGYPTVIGNIASYCLSVGDTPDTFAVKGVITTSEPLTEETRKTIIKCFDTEVLSRYSSEELGVIAQECGICKEYHTNHYTHIVEVLKLNSDDRAGPGELGRVVVTDLYNRAFPLVRYDTGDLAEYVPVSQNKCGVPALKNLQGRAIEVIYTTAGEKITPMAINGVFRDNEDSDKIIQYQFIQEDEKKYRLLLQLIGKSLSTKPIVDTLKEKLGQDADVKIEFVTHIPALKSGKRPYIINNYKN